MWIARKRPSGPLGISRSGEFWISGGAGQAAACSWEADGSWELLWAAAQFSGRS